MGVERAGEVSGREDPHCVQILPEVREMIAIQVVKDAVAIPRPLLFPVERRPAEVRHGRQNIERTAAGRGKARIGDAGIVQIEREIVLQGAAAKDVAHQLPVAGAEQHGVMRHVGIGFAHPEVDDEERHGKAHRAEPLGLSNATAGAAEQCAVRMDEVAVRGDDVEAVQLPSGPHAGGGVAGDDDLFDGG
jgi:hypothetical protein